MKDVRELMARLNPTTTRMDIGSGGGVDAIANIDIATALGMVPRGIGRDLMELLHGPDPSRNEVIKVLEGVTRLVLEERNRRSNEYAGARATLGIAECVARFNKDRQDGTQRHLAILRTRVALPEASSCLRGWRNGCRKLQR